MQRCKPFIRKNPVAIFCKTDTSRISPSKSLSSNIRYHLSLGQPGEALVSFLEWQQQGLTPDKFTIPSLLKLSSALGESPLHGEQIHAFTIKSGFVHDLFISAGLTEMYFKYGNTDAPLRLFNETCTRDVAFYTTMISGHTQIGHGCEALSFFFKMLNEGIEPNAISLTSVLSLCSQLRKLSLGKTIHGHSLRKGFFTMASIIFLTAVVDMYCKCESLSYAKNVFDRMTERNLVSWNSIINGYFSNGSYLSALLLFRDLFLEGWQQPKFSTLTMVLNICGMTNDLRKGKQVHGFVLKCCSNSGQLENLMVWNSVIHMYIRTGDIDTAILLSDRMPERNVVTWTTMISGYGTHGSCSKALIAFDEMRGSGIRPEGVTFLSVLSACSHAGLVDKGRELFLSMQRDYNIIPEMKHFECMVDLFGRAGLLKEAFEFISTMPVEPSKSVWRALLSSCRNHKNLELGEFAARKTLELDRFDVGSYILLSRLYAEAHKWKDVARVRSVMRDLGLKVDTAFSWVNIRGKVYRFTVGDWLKADSRKMYQFLEKAGFVADTSIAGHDVKEEAKVSDLCGHTEKLALAFVLTSYPSEGLIRIGKNLRVCRDCHEAFKFVSMIYHKEIILKDPNMYHRFSQGLCSCHDFW